MKVLFFPCVRNLMSTIPFQLLPPKCTAISQAIDRETKTWNLKPLPHMTSKMSGPEWKELSSDIRRDFRTDRHVGTKAEILTVPQTQS